MHSEFELDVITGLMLAAISLILFTLISHGFIDFGWELIFKIIEYYLLFNFALSISDSNIPKSHGWIFSIPILKGQMYHVLSYSCLVLVSLLFVGLGLTSSWYSHTLAILQSLVVMWGFLQFAPMLYRVHKINKLLNQKLNLNITLTGLSVRQDYSDCILFYSQGSDTAVEQKITLKLSPKGKILLQESIFTALDPLDNAIFNDFIDSAPKGES